MRSAAAEVADLRRLAALYGIQTSYIDVRGHRQRASPESLLAVLHAWGVPLDGMRQVPAALRERRAASWRKGVQPVAVAWNGRLAGLDLRLPDGPHRPVTCLLQLEDEKTIGWRAEPRHLRTLESVQVEGRRYVRKRLTLPGRLPIGYHRLTIQVGKRRAETLIIAAPRGAYVGAGNEPAETWGVFLPLYALRSRESWGIGDFADLQALISWAGDRGGGVVATLPLLAAFLETPFEASPYIPVSRLFWNEIYLDVTRNPHLDRCPEARAVLESVALRREVDELQAAPLVDYRRTMQAKRRVLNVLAQCFFRNPSPHRDAFFQFVAQHPALEDYARFRAAGERLQTPWPAWPKRLREGRVAEGDYDEAARRYHLYVQWLAHDHLATLAREARRRGPGLYLDLPLGVHPDGYDVWRERDVFVREASGGAPPDAFFTKGQTWGFPPLHPRRLREERYRYFIAVIRHHLQHAGVLRIDHVMGLHRLFWVPHGMGAQNGAYVTYPAEEFYAILALESHRHRAIIVGEDLGTVPPDVRPAMTRHRVAQMYVVQYEARRSRRALRSIPAQALASLNTHDMPPFARWWNGLDIRDRQALGLMNPADARRERRQRRALKADLVEFLWARRWRLPERAGAAGVLRALLSHLAASRAQIVIINLEDLWLERQPQNVPGTGLERPNWRRKARYGLEDFARLRPVVTALRLVHRWRGQKRKTGS